MINGDNIMKITRYLEENGKKIIHAEYTKEELAEIRKRIEEYKKQHEKTETAEEGGKDGE